MRCYLLIIVIFMLNGCAQQKAPDKNWTILFDGKSLNGWFNVHGDQPFKVHNGEIVGSTHANITTRYLTTKKQYGDFILTLEMNNTQGANSGVQFRSVTTAPFYQGLTGYQLEVDPSDRFWTGGIYFEGVGEWRHPLMNNKACGKAWNKKGWNRLRIETKGYQNRTFINDVPCSYLFDQYLIKGHIGLQIHSIGNDASMSGKESRWRNIRILENPKEIDYTPENVNADSRSHLIDKLSTAEIATNWQMARKQNTKSSNNWKKTELYNPINNEKWSVNTLQITAGEQTELLTIPVNTDGYHVIGHFKIDEGTTGEIIYPIVLTDEKGILKTCLASYRISDDRAVNDPNLHQYNLMADLTGQRTAINLSEPNSPKRVLFTPSWRWFGIKATANQSQHWLNSVKVVEYNGCADYPVQNATNKEKSKIHIRIDKGKIIFRNLKYKNSPI
mgnify:CR=1 FL=1